MGDIAEDKSTINKLPNPLKHQISNDNVANKSTNSISIQTGKFGLDLLSNITSKNTPQFHKNTNPQSETPLIIVNPSSIPKMINKNLIFNYNDNDLEEIREKKSNFSFLENSSDHEIIEEKSSVISSLKPGSLSQNNTHSNSNALGYDMNSIEDVSYIKHARISETTLQTQSKNGLGDFFKVDNNQDNKGPVMFRRLTDSHQGTIQNNLNITKYNNLRKKKSRNYTIANDTTTKRSSYGRFGEDYTDNTPNITNSIFDTSLTQFCSKKSLGALKVSLGDISMESQSYRDAQAVQLQLSDYLENEIRQY